MAKRLSPGVNSFGLLASDDESDPPVGSIPDPAPSSGPRSSPPSLVSTLTRHLTSDSPTLSELAEALHSLLHINQKRQFEWCADYESYDKLNVEAYEKKFTDRVHCFDHLHDPELFQFIDSRIAALRSELDIDTLIERTAQLLATPKKRVGHGHLFLVGRILCLAPDLGRQIKVPKQSIVERGPVLCWLFRYLDEHNAGWLSPRFLVSLFHGYLIDPDQVYAPLSVAVAHLIRLSARKQQAIPASYFVFLFELRQRTGSNRNVHVRQVMTPVLDEEKIVISDMQNFPKVLMGRYKQCPQRVVNGFVTYSTRNPDFFNGWVSHHHENLEISTKYLQAAAAKLPLELLERFPREDWEKTDDMTEQLAVYQKKLTAASGRFLGISVVVCLVTFLFLGTPK